MKQMLTLVLLAIGMAACAQTTTLRSKLVGAWSMAPADASAAAAMEGTIRLTLNADGSCVEELTTSMVERTNDVEVDVRFVVILPGTWRIIGADNLELTMSGHETYHADVLHVKVNGIDQTNSLLDEVQKLVQQFVNEYDNGGGHVIMKVAFSAADMFTADDDGFALVCHRQPTSKQLLDRLAGLGSPLLVR